MGAACICGLLSFVLLPNTQPPPRVQNWTSALLYVTGIALAVVAMLLPGVDPISFILEFVPLLALYGLSYFIVVAVEKAQGADEPDPEPLT